MLDRPIRMDPERTSVGPLLAGKRPIAERSPAMAESDFSLLSQLQSIVDLDSEMLSSFVWPRRS